MKTDIANTVVKSSKARKIINEIRGYVQYYELSKGRDPDRITVTKEAFDALIGAMPKGTTEICYEGIDCGFN